MQTFLWARNNFGTQIVSYGKYLSIVACWIYKLFNSSTLLLRITERLHCKSSSSSLFKSRVFSVALTSVSLKVQSELYSFNIFNILQMKFRIERNIWLEIFDSQRFLLNLIRPWLFHDGGSFHLETNLGLVSI